MTTTTPLTSFESLVKRHEIPADLVLLLKKYISKAEIVIICDDSYSMTSEIVDPITKKSTTRWMELKKLVAKLIEYTIALNEAGVELYFMNRGTVRNVKSMTGLQETFSQVPDEKAHTPLVGTLKKIYSDKAVLRPGATDLLIICITDGVASDGSHEIVERTIRSKGPNVHLSMAECTDDISTMDWLDELCKVPAYNSYYSERYYEEQRRVIPNFSNTDYIREEIEKVKRIQGPSFKFDENDYVVKILLATYVKEYNLVDQSVNRTIPPTAYNNPPYTNYNSNQNSDCCIVS